MAKRKGKGIINYLGLSLNDKDLIGNDNIDMSDVGSNKVPRRTETPLTKLSTKNSLNMILESGKKLNKKGR